MGSSSGKFELPNDLAQQSRASLGALVGSFAELGGTLPDRRRGWAWATRRAEGACLADGQRAWLCRFASASCAALVRSRASLPWFPSRRNSSRDWRQDLQQGWALVAQPRGLPQDPESAQLSPATKEDRDAEVLRQVGGAGPGVILDRLGEANQERHARSHCGRRAAERRPASRIRGASAGRQRRPRLMTDDHEHDATARGLVGQCTSHGPASP